MPLAGQRIRALDFTDGVDNTQADIFTFNSTTFGTDNDSGTYVDCGEAFLAPTSGKVVIAFSADIDNDTAGATTSVAPAIREGGTVGSGATVLAASLDNQIRNVGTDNIQVGRTLPVAGLTPGDTYNVRLEHRVSSGIGTLLRRNVSVDPRPGPPA